MRTVLLDAAGAVIVLFVLRDIFHELFHPSGRGGMSGRIMERGWELFRAVSRRRPARLRLAGPVLMLTVIGTWTVLLVLGWALIFLPHLPGAYLYSTGLDPSRNDGFSTAVYLSTVTLATLGFGDITPTSTPLRILAPLEALVGFVLLTASISWLLSLYPVLSGRRSFAHGIWLLRRAEEGTGLALADPETQPGEVLQQLTTQLASVRNDLIQFPISYYFYAGGERNVLSTNLPYLLRVADELEERDLAPPLRLRAAAFRAALDDLLGVLADEFLDVPASAERAEILEAYARDHLRGEATSGG